MSWSGIFINRSFRKLCRFGRFQLAFFVFSFVTKPLAIFLKTRPCLYKNNFNHQINRSDLRVLFIIRNCPNFLPVLEPKLEHCLFYLLNDGAKQKRLPCLKIMYTQVKKSYVCPNFLPFLEPKLEHLLQRNFALIFCLF